MYRRTVRGDTRSLRFDDDEQMTPFEDARHADQDDPRRVVSAARLHAPFHVQRERLSQEEVFGGGLDT
jgi:hypothetical protein